jgi:hypothetical protein
MKTEKTINFFRILSSFVSVFKSFAQRVQNNERGSFPETVEDAIRQRGRAPSEKHEMNFYGWSIPIKKNDAPK